MSTNSSSSQLRSRRASRRSLKSGDTPHASLSSPVSMPRKPLNRLHSLSTTSLPLSELSDIFNREESTPSRLTSPSTPPRENAPAQRLTKSGPKSRRCQTQAAETPSKSASSDDTIPVIRKRSSSKKSGLSTAKEPIPQVIGSLLAPQHDATKHRRTVSEPAKLSPREHAVDVDRLHIPGKYESQNSNYNVNFDQESDLSIPSIILDSDDDNEENGKTTASEFSEQDEPMNYDLIVSSEAAPAVHCKTACGSNGIQSSFVPYNCVKDDPTKREPKDELDNNADIRQLLLERHNKRSELGWVYIAESKKHLYGPEKLKIGFTKAAKTTPKYRIKKQECGVALTEVTDQNQNPYPYAGLLEKIIHLELRDKRLKRICRHPGLKVHSPNEWFDTDQSNALRIVELWRDWMILQEPIDASGLLTPFWKWKTERLIESIAEVDWESWTKPRASEYWAFLVHVHFARSRKDIGYYGRGAFVALLSYIGHGVKGAVWAIILLLLL